MGLELQFCCAWCQPSSPPHPWKQLPPISSPAGAGGSPLLSLGAAVSPLLSPSLTGSRGRTNCCVGGAGAAARAFVPRYLRLGSRSLLPAPRPPAHAK